ncbi:hypothetical protein [Nocardia sp. NPDC004860]|uniref:hypothetical protein n=1 Tax=Nocardia sp. NPDC004860 TaxID=3154557 RepID=UPI0033AA3E8C
MTKQPKKIRRSPRSVRRIVVTSEQRDSPDLRALSRAIITQMIDQAKTQAADSDSNPTQETSPEG